MPQPLCIPACAHVSLKHRECVQNHSNQRDLNWKAVKTGAFWCQSLCIKGSPQPHLLNRWLSTMFGRCLGHTCFEILCLSPPLTLGYAFHHWMIRWGGLCRQKWKTQAKPNFRRAPGFQLFSKPKHSTELQRVDTHTPFFSVFSHFFFILLHCIHSSIYLYLLSKPCFLQISLIFNEK